MAGGSASSDPREVVDWSAEVAADAAAAVYGYSVDKGWYGASSDAASAAGAWTES